MPRVRLQWTVEDAPGKMRVADGGELVNLYPEILSGGAKSEVVLYGTPGLEPFADVPTPPIRALHQFQDAVLVITNTKVYRLDSDGTLTPLGHSGFGYVDIALDPSGHVSVADNGIQAVIVDGTSGYWTDPNDDDAPYEITAPGFSPADTVTFQDGYFIFNRAGTRQFFLSDLYATTFDPLNFASAEAVPDDLLAVFSLRQTLWLFGSRSIEFWYNSGGADFPFERLQGQFASQGIAAIASIVPMDNSLFWLGADRIVYRAEGYTPVRVSTHAMESLIQYGDISDAHAYTYMERGHAFYVLTLPTLKLTIAYDAATGVWHRRRNYTFGRQLPGSYVHAFGQHLVGDFQAGRIYTMRENVYEDAGDPIVREAVSPPITMDGTRLRMNRFELEMQGGIGLNMAQGVDPQAMLQWSDDNGHTWSREHWAKIGKIGEYTTRVAWRRMGAFRDRRIRVRISDPVPVSMLRAWTEVDRAAS